MKCRGELHDLGRLVHHEHTKAEHHNRAPHDSQVANCLVHECRSESCKVGTGP